MVAEDVPRAIGVARDRRAVAGLVGDAEQALDAERERPRDEKRELLPLVVMQWPQEHQLQPDAEDEHRRSQKQQPDERVDAKISVERVAQVGAEDDQRPLSYVDDTHHPESEGQATRHQRIDAAGEEAEDAGLDEEMHLCVSLRST